MSFKVSVIIPCYNSEKYLMEAIASVHRQTYLNIELIVVDDGSTDNSSILVSGCLEDSDIYRYVLLPENHGMAFARNVGIKASSGELIALLDSDDMFTEDSIAKRVEYFNNHPNTQVVWGNAYEIRGDTNYLEADKLGSTLRVHPSEVNPQTVMYRREVFKKYGGFYEPLKSGTDKEMCMRLGIHPESPFKGLLKAKKLKDALCFYRKHPKQVHKLRKADPAWYKETKKIQKRRLKQLKREGITRENTRFPI